MRILRCRRTVASCQEMSVWTSADEHRLPTSSLMSSWAVQDYRVVRFSFALHLEALFTRRV